MELNKVSEVSKVTAKTHFIFNGESILNINVSAWQSYFDSANPKDVNLLTWLTSPKYADKVNAIRSMADKNERSKLKATLPAITPSGTFTQREESGLILHSGFIQFDIDLKDNTHITNYTELKEQLANIREIAYCGLSVSGTGFWGLIPILHPEKHTAHVMALQHDFKSLGIVIDAKPKNVASLRGYSWDPEAYFNHQATLYTNLYEPKPERYSRADSTYHHQSTEAEKVEAILQQIESGSIDITQGYGTWFAIGCALANQFGESGRQYFHQVSQYHPDYKYHKTDNQFDEYLKHNGYKYTLGTFFAIAKDYGLEWKNILKADTVPMQPKPATLPLLPVTIETVLPDGFRWVYGSTMEFDGLPLQMLNTSEMEDAKQRLKENGYLLPAIPQEALILRK